MKHNKHRLNGILMLITLALLTGRAGAEVYDDVAAGFWTNPATWSPSTGCPTNAGDSATVNSVVVSASASALVPKIQLIDIARTASTTGTLFFTDGTVQTPNLQLNGGMLKQYGNAGTDLAWSILSNGVVTVKSNSQWYVVGHANHTVGQTAVNYDEIRDWAQGGVTNTGLLTLDGSEVARLAHYGAGTNFTGGWLIKTGPGAATVPNGRGALNLYTDGGLGSGTCTVQTVLNVYAGQSGSPGRPKPARVIVQPTWPDCGVYLDPTPSGQGLSITNWDFDLYGGYLAFGDRASTYAGGTVTLYSNAVFYGKRDTRWTATSTYNGEIRGTNSITFDAAGADRAGHAFYLGGNNTNFSGGVTLLRNRLYVTHPNALGTGPVMLRPADADGSLYLDATPNANWALSNTLAGTSSIVVEDGAGTNTLTVLGTVDPGTNGVTVTTNSTGILRVDGNMAFGAGSRLKIDIAGTNGVAGVDFDRLVVDHNLTGLGNAMLEVSLSAALSNAAIRGLDVVVVSNATSLGSARFGSFQFTAPWQADVLYDNPPGTVRLMNFQDYRGTVFKFR